MPEAQLVVMHDGTCRQAWVMNSGRRVASSTAHAQSPHCCAGMQEDSGCCSDAGDTMAAGCRCTAAAAARMPEAKENRLQTPVHTPVDGPVAPVLLDKGVHLLVEARGLLWHAHPCGVQPADQRHNSLLCGAQALDPCAGGPDRCWRGVYSGRFWWLAVPTLACPDTTESWRAGACWGLARPHCHGCCHSALLAAQQQSWRCTQAVLGLSALLRGTASAAG